MSDAYLVSPAPAASRSIDPTESMLLLSQLLCAATGDDRSLQDVAELVSGIIDAAGIAICLLSSDGRAVRAAGLCGDMERPLDVLGGAFAPGPGAGAPVTVDAHPDRPGAMIFPMRAHGRSLGFLLVRPRQHPHRDERQRLVRLAETIANLIAASLPQITREAPAGAADDRARVRDLVQMVIDGDGLGGLVIALEDLLGNPVTVADPMFHHVAYSPRQERTDRHRQESLARGGTVREALDDPRVRREFGLPEVHRAPIILGTFPEYGWVQRRMQAPIFLGRDLVGRVTVSETERHFEDRDAQVLQEAAAALAIAFMHRRIALETEYRLRSDFLAKLLAPGAIDTAELLERASYVGIDLLRPHTLLLATLDPEEAPAPAWAPPPGDNLRRRGRDAILSAAVAMDPGNVAVPHHDGVVVFAPGGDGDPGRLRRLGEAMRRAPYRISTSLTVSVGVGALCHDVTDYPRSYARAERAIATARGLGRRDAVTSLDDLGVSALLFRGDDSAEMTQFVTATLGDLLQYDHRHQTQLVETLSVYFEAGGNKRETAERLGLHVNTLAGRFQRIAEVGGIDLSDATTRLNLQLALRLRQFSQRSSHP